MYEIIINFDSYFDFNRILMKTYIIYLYVRIKIYLKLVVKRYPFYSSESFLGVRERSLYRFQCTRNNKEPAKLPNSQHLSSHESLQEHRSYSRNM